MKVRVLTDTIPAWLALALLEHHEPELVVGKPARDELHHELVPRAVDRTKGRRAS